MNRILLYVFVILSLFISCDKSKKTIKGTLIHEEKIEKLLNFFNENAYQETQGTYYSDVDNEGKVVSDKVYNVALSRLIYGLSYAKDVDVSYLAKAEKAADFQIEKLIIKDSLNTYFASFFDLKTNKADSSYNLDIWQQAYGLCGLSELYRQGPSKNLLDKIHQSHDSFIKTFHDSIVGGFYGNYADDAQVEGSKTLQALIYPITAYMENLWSVDVENRSKYEPYLKENIQIAFDKGWNKELGWVNIKFDDSWNPCQHSSQDSICFSVTPGHNFQYASIFLRAKEWEFLTKKEQLKYHDFGIEVLNTTLEKPIFPEKDLSQGFYSEVNPVSNEITDKRKTWWQHCEALISLSLADDKFKIKAKNLENFYFNTFPDNENGGEFFYVNELNIPQTDELKGNIGKSTYHTIEMIKFLNK